MGATLERNVMQFIKGAGCESSLSQNPIKLMIFIACGSPLVCVILIRSPGSKSDKTKTAFEYILGRGTRERRVCAADGPGAHMGPGVSPSVLFCSILSQKNNSNPLWPLNPPGKEEPPQNCSPSPFWHAWTQKIHNVLRPGLQAGL